MTEQPYTPQLWTSDELCEHAFHIFEEVAADNLSAADYQLYQQHAEQHAYVELVTPLDDWLELTGAESQQGQPELQLEAQIGLSGVGPAGADLVLARILLSQDKDESLCHARWRGQ